MTRFADKRYLEGELGVELHRVGQATRQPAFHWLPELDADPEAPSDGVRLYVVADNGGGKRELRALFPSGSPQTIATEP